jgi:hypothetical protein
MESCAKYPIFYLLVVNHDSRFWEEACETVFDSEFAGGRSAIFRTARAPEIQRGTVSFELPDVFDDARHGNSRCASGLDECVINVNVNDHGVVVGVGSLMRRT